MPEYTLPLGAASDEFYGLTPFEQGFIEAFFYVFNRDDETGKVSNGKGFDDLAPDSLIQIQAVCRKFTSDLQVAVLLTQTYAKGRYTPEQAGSDFLLTIAGHGVGFIDRDEIEIPSHGGQSIADILDSRATEVCSHIEEYVGDDGLVYVDF